MSCGGLFLSLAPDPAGGIEMQLAPGAGIVSRKLRTVWDAAHNAAAVSQTPASEEAKILLELRYQTKTSKIWLQPSALK